MLLESIKLHNFRQYRDAFLDFAQDVHGKNVTIIIGVCMVSQILRILLF